MAAQENVTPASRGETDTTAVSTDNLTSQIAGMSKHQLYQIVSQMKDLIQQNQQQARQILIDNPQLTKTLFQAQIMLGMVRAPDTLPPASLTPSAHLPPTTATTQVPQQPPAQLRAPQVPLTSPPQTAGLFQPQPSTQPASQQPPPQMASTYLPQSQATSLPMHTNQPPFAYQQSVQIPSHPLPGGTMQSSMQQASSQPPLPLHPPPLPQQPRPLAPPSQVQQQSTPAMGFVPPSVPQAYHSQPAYMQQAGPSPAANVGLAFQQMHAPPLPSQLPPQHVFQVPRDMNGSANTASGGLLQVGGALESGRGLNMSATAVSASSMTWNQGPPLTGPTSVAQVAPAAHMVPGQSFVGAGAGLGPTMVPGPGSNISQGFTQNMPQPQPPQQLQHQPQVQMPIELEQQKALIQQVMNLTPEQINSLPPEQRQQVLQLQQAFRSQTGQ